MQSAARPAKPAALPQARQSTETLFKLSKVPALVEQITGDRCHIATVHRWHQRGVKGIKLQTAFAGGHRRTTEAWVRQFFADITAAANGTDQSVPSDSPARSASLAKAERELEAAGI